MSGRPNELEPAATRHLWMTVLLAGLIGLTIVLVTAPLTALLGESGGAIPAAVHGTLAGLFMVTSTIGLFQAYRIFSGHAANLSELQLGSLVNVSVALLTIISGNWVYIPYRAPGGPRGYFVEHAAAVHKVFFEFKEFAALFTLPLSVAAAYLLIRYGRDLYRIKGLSTLISILLVLVFFYFIVAFGLGAAVTKLRSV